MIVVNLPEHPWNREGYRPEYYQNYLEVVQGALGDTPFLNLREFLELDEFYDVGHPTLAGAVHLSDRVVEFVEKHLQRDPL